MSENRKYNLPVAIIAIAMIALLLLCIFSPAIASFVKAGSEDGFTLDAFDFGPSRWWDAGLIFLVLGLMIVLLFFLHVVQESCG